MGFLRRFYDPRRPGSWAHRARQRRFLLFEELLDSLPRPLTILDVGGTEAFWQTMGFTDRPGVAVTLLNPAPVTTTLAGFEYVAGDARDLGQFPDASFDVVFSNSVIEHVGAPADQQAMADEVRRVARRYFVQTPNRYFPIEPHFVFPFFQFFPARLRAWLVAHFDLGWVKKQDPVAARELVDSVQLLGRRTFASLFPDAELRRETVLGLTKSFIAYMPGDNGR